jgi:hypothetical protein
VLLVEEAGEILESHIMTALSDDIEQIILIGDHKYEHCLFIVRFHNCADLLTDNSALRSIITI